MPKKRKNSFPRASCEAVAKRQARANETDEQREERLAIQRDSRANETDEQREERLAKKRDRQSSSRANETDEQCEERLAIQRDRQSSSRANETDEQCEERLAIQRDSRANETDEQREERLAKKRDRQSSSRANETDEQCEERLAIQRDRQSSSRANETDEQCEERLAIQRDSRANETDEQREERLAKKRDRQSSSRANETNEQHEERIAEVRQARVDRPQRHIPPPDRRPKKYDGRHAQDILHGRREVKYHDIGPLFDENGVPTHPPCPHCHAMKWKGEPKAMCCDNGSVTLPLIEKPSFFFEKLWLSDGEREKVFRRYVRQLNNATALASLKVKYPAIRGPYKPSVTIQGKVAVFLGTVPAPQGQTPLFSQLYVLDPDHRDSEHELRFASMRLPDSIRETEKHQLRDLLHQLQHELRENCYVKTFITACEIVERDNPDPIQIIMDEKKRPDGEHARVFNAGYREISALSDDQTPGDRSIVVHVRGQENKLQEISDTHRSYDPLHFILLFPTGQDGWHLHLTKTDSRGRVKRLTTLDFYAFHLQLFHIPENPQRFFLHRGQRLFQEYLCISFAKVENQRLKFIANNQKKLRSEKYGRLCEDVRSHEADKQQLLKSGVRVILPPSFMNSYRYFHDHFQKAMAIVREYHKPDLFITFTCNQNWPEILQSLLPGQKPEDRPDIIARVFNMKLKAFKDEITKDGILGRRAAIIDVREFQKRGLPHAHLLLIFPEEDRLHTADDVDDIICAEFPPDPETLPEGPEKDRVKKLEKLVLTHMVHTCKKDRCSEKGYCNKGFPKDYSEATEWDDNAFYPKYRRREGRVVLDKNGQPVTNQRVVPYNPYLLLRFNCHINVEACVSPTAAKYLFKYVTKGPDRAMVSNDLDEVRIYQMFRSIGSSEACWRLLKFPIAEQYPSVMSLRIHLEGQQFVMFQEGEEEAAVDQGPKITELDAFFDYNTKHPETAVKYIDFPKKFTWHQAKHCWQPRKKNLEMIGRLHTIHPMAGDEFYLRFLLHHDHSKGAASFEQLKTINGQRFDSYKEVCCELGLLQDDKEWDDTLTEAAITNFCSQIRQLFVIILLFCDPAEPRLLFDTHVSEWWDDFKRKYPNATDDDLKICVLLHLQALITEKGKTLEAYNLPTVNDEQRTEHAVLTNTPAMEEVSVVMQEEQNFNIEETSESHNQQERLLTDAQRIVYDKVMFALENKSPLTLFLSARGGTGKTFLLNTILDAARTLHGEKHVALAVASSGIAATLLHLGRTFHSRFKVPVTQDDNMTFSVKPTDVLATVIRLCEIIEWDEAPMTKRSIWEALDRCLRDITGIDQPFGGKVLVMAGDFRQVLPVLPRKSRAQIVAASLQNSYLWSEVEVVELTKNMRLAQDPDAQDFDKWLLDLGNGTLPIVETPDKIALPLDSVFSIDDSSFESTKISMKAFIELIYPEFGQKYTHSTNDVWLPWISERAILAPKNTEVDKINNVVSEMFPGEAFIALSADCTVEPDDATRFPTDYLNSLTPSGLSPQELKLKKGMVLMLLRNLNPREGLCNGTRLILQNATKFLLYCKIATGDKAGKDVLIPRIDLTTNDTDFPFKWKRRQFPVRPAFAMTINKSQGQTLNRVGVWLFDPVFSHGQLYVAASRVRHPKQLFFALKQSDNNLTRNVVYKECLLK